MRLPWTTELDCCWLTCKKKHGNPANCIARCTIHQAPAAFSHVCPLAAPGHSQAEVRIIKLGNPWHRSCKTKSACTCRCRASHCALIQMPAAESSTGFGPLFCPSVCPSAAHLSNAQRLYLPLQGLQLGHRILQALLQSSTPNMLPQPVPAAGHFAYCPLLCCLIA